MRDLAGLDGLLARAGWSERPLAVLDLDAVDANADDLLRRAGGTPVRIASKSLRVRGLLDRLLARPGIAGILAFTLPEALWLVAHGARDVLVAYPTAERGALRRLAASPEALGAITLMVDETASSPRSGRHAPAVSRCACSAAATPSPRWWRPTGCSSPSTAIKAWSAPIPRPAW